MSRELVPVASLQEFFDPSEEAFIKAVLLACAKHRCLFYVERGVDLAKLFLGEAPAAPVGECRFSILLPDTRTVSSVRYEAPRVALSRICRAVLPYLEKYEREEIDRRQAQTRFAKPPPEKGA